MQLSTCALSCESCVQACTLCLDCTGFPSNAHFLLEVKKHLRERYPNENIDSVPLHHLPLCPQRQNNKSGVTGRRRPVKLRLFLRVHRGRKASSRYIRRGARKHKSSFSLMLCYLGRWMIPIHPFPLPLKSNQLLAERWYYVRLMSCRSEAGSCLIALLENTFICALPWQNARSPKWLSPMLFGLFFSFSFAFLLLFRLLLFSVACKSGEKQLAVLIEDALLQGNKEVLLGL